MRIISQEGLDLIKSFEGLRLKAYKDSVGVLTLGYGHTNAAGPPLVKSGMRITKEQAERILEEDLSQYEKAVEASVHTALNNNEYAALVSLCYNIGPGNFKKSTLVKHLNDGDRDVRGEFLKWARAGGKVLPGLTRRRQAEYLLFTTDSGSKPVVQSPEPTMATSREGNTAIATGAGGTLIAATEIIKQAQSSGDTLTSFIHAMSNPIFLIAIGIIAAAGAIWYWRRERMRQHGV